MKKKTPYSWIGKLNIVNFSMSTTNVIYRFKAILIKTLMMFLHQWEFSYIAGRNVKWHNYFRKCFLSQKCIYNPSITVLGVMQGK